MLQDIEDIKEFLYQSCNSSHGEYCLKEWVDPGSRIPSQTDRNYIQVSNQLMGSGVPVFEVAGAGITINIYS